MFDFFRTIYPSTCGDLRGTSAGFTPVDLDRQFVDYFSTDICRYVCETFLGKDFKFSLTVCESQTDPVHKRERDHGGGSEGNKICSQRHRHIWFVLHILLILRSSRGQESTSPHYRQRKYKSGQLVLQRKPSLWRSQLYWLQRRRHNPQVSPDDQC